MKIFVITGQTATGKTNAALKLASEVEGELVNFDSRQIYKKLDIVTGKDIVTKNFHKVAGRKEFDIGYFDIQKTRLWLYDAADPKQVFSSHDFVKCAIQAVRHILKEKKTPIFVGGTYLYLYHLLYEVPQGNPPNWKLREELEELDIPKLQARLEKKAPELYAKLNNSDLNNPHRLMRKIELVESGQKTFANLPRERISLGEKLGIDDLEVEISGYRHENPEDLRKAVTERVEKRLAGGAVEELKKLLEEGYTLQDPGLMSIGYPQIKKYIDGLITMEELKTEWVTKEVKYAKRQYTFMKRDKNIVWRHIYTSSYKL